MLRPGAGQVGQIEQLQAAIGAGGNGDARFFANLRQGERPVILEKTGIGHAAALWLGLERCWRGGRAAFRFTLKDGSFWFSRLMASPVMSKPLAVGEHHRLLVQHQVGAAFLHQLLQDRSELAFHGRRAPGERRP